MGTYSVEFVLTSFMPNSINNFFIFIMFGIFAIGIYFFKKNKYTNFVTYIPSLLTSIGIFGTFVGISIGLVNFEPTNIDKSISDLLNGMKTAFYSSLVGILFSIIFKIILSIFKNNNPDTMEEDDKLLYLIEKQTYMVENISKLLGGDNDTSFLNQVKLFKADVNDYIRYIKEYNETFTNNLWNKMENFADILSKSATETIIQALNDVIKDFNKNLTEQFGDNFKQLNSAVLKLVEWQEQYKNQLELWQKNYDDHKIRIDTLTQQQQEYIDLLFQASQMIEKSSNSLDIIAENTKEIPNNMQNLTEIMEIHEKQLQDLDNYLKAFEEVKEKASKAFPEIRDNVDDIINTIKDTVDATSYHYNQLLNKTDEIQQSFNEILTRIIDEQKIHINNIFNTLSEKITENTNNINKTIENSLEDMLTSQNKGIDALFSKIDTTLEEQVSKTSESIDKQVKKIDESMEQELKRGLEEIGIALAQISAKVVEEYNKMISEKND